MENKYLIGLDYIINELGFNTREVEAMWWYLSQQNYIEDFGNGQMILAFKGLILLNIKNGFVEEDKSNNLRYRKEKINEKRVAFGAVFAACFSGGLLIWEIAKWCLDRLPFCNCHH